MRNVQWISAGLCAGLLFSTSASFADGSSPPTTQSPTAAAPTDKAFLVRALRVNQLELVLGRMAIKRATTAEVQAMGEKMVKKHTELGWKLSELAQVDPASAPGLSTDQQRTVARLASLSEYDFDKAFKYTVDAGHVEELAMYREEVGRAADPRLRTLAQDRVAALELSMASAQASNTPPKKRGW
jgi:predicted outer membrane protein